MEKKVGVYICSGCGIGEAVDVEAMAKVATSEYKVPVVKDHAILCGAEGSELIRQDIAQEGVNAIVVCACSKRAKTDVFAYDTSQTVLERVNVREQVAWCQTPEKDDEAKEDTQMLAEDYLRMGIVKAQKMEPPEPFLEEISKNILVVGGGLTGMTAASEAAAAGYGVVLVEKEAQLGGYMGKLHKALPRKAPYTDMEDTNIGELAKAVEENEKIKVYKGAHIDATDGSPGMFDVTIQAGGATETERVGAIVQAAGFVPYDAGKLTHLGYGESPNVVTPLDIEKMALNGGIKRPSDGNPARSVAFIQCAGSRDPEHLPYCSAVCCMTSLKQAKYIREADPEAKVYVLYKDMRTPGQNENFYKQMQQDEGIFLTKGEVASVQVDADQGLRVEVDNTLLGEKIEISADLLVLATGMMPATALGEEVAVVEEEEGDKKKDADAKEPAADRIIKSDILNLTYRQGPEMPALKYGFPDSHYVCFPYESRRTGIYPAGCVRQPMTAAMAGDDAAGAALKAIQCVEMASRGEAVHPRSGDQTYPDLFLQRCTQCKRCTEECPFGAIDDDEKGTPKPNPARCRRCGTCMGCCPERIINFVDYSIDSIGSMVKAVGVPSEDDFDEPPLRILGLVCENDAYPALDIVGLNRMTYSAEVRIIPVRCLGSVNVIWIKDALAQGMDGVFLLGCKHGDDYQCHFVKGSELAEIRMKKIGEALSSLALEEERVAQFQVAIDEYDKIPQIIDDFAALVEEMGPNPFKGF